MLRGESQQGGHSQRYPGRHGLRLDPETDPGHHHDQTGGDVGVEHEVAQPPSELEDHHEAGEVPGGVGGGAVLCGVVDQLELGELEGLHHQRDTLWGIPLEYQVVSGVGH